MKTKLVLWGTNEQEERVLIALELLPQENVVRSYVFPEQIASEEFSQQMLDVWRDGKPLEFPQGYVTENRELTLTESILPAGIKPERDDIISRAQTEWHFVVLSSKLHETYVSELNEIKERIEKLTRFESGVWDELKNFWEKVQTQVREKNLFREHGDTLRDKTNELFGEMKSLRNKLDQEFEQLSRDNLDRFQELLSEIERKLENGGRLQGLFDELKSLQEKFRNTKFTKEHRNKVWDTLDGLFKSVKERRFGSAPADDRSPSERLKRRFEGLLSAIEKMERSIQRDEDDLTYHKRKVETTYGQLEAQLGQAKILMIEERIRSKKDKLSEMLETKVDLEKRLESQRSKDARKAEREKLDEARKAAEEKIASEIKAAAEAREPDAEKLEKAAEELTHASEKAEEAAATAAPEEKESLLEAISDTLTDSLEDMVDTVKAVAGVVGDKLEEAYEDIKEKIEEALEPAETPEAAEASRPAPDQPEGAEEVFQHEDTAPQSPENEADAADAGETEPPKE